MDSSTRSPRIVFSLILVAFIGSAGANDVETEFERRLEAGAAAVDITPKLGVSLDGPISKNGPVTGIHDRLYARALILDDSTTRIAIVICNASIIGQDVFDAAKAKVQEEIGLPPNRMLVAATHTHAAPRSMHIATGTLDDEYHHFLAERIAEAVVAAAKNVAPAQVGCGSFDKPEFVRCRRFLCQPGSVGVNPFGESGEQCKSVSGQSSAVIKPAGPVDPQLSILSVRHADGSPLAVLANFSVHYCGGYARGQVSADYFGFFAATLQEKLQAGEGHPPFVGIMSNGTSGNTSSIERGGKSYPAFGWMEESGRILAEQTAKVLASIEHRSDVTLGMVESEIELAVRRPDRERLAWAENVLAHPQRSYPHRWTRVFAREAVFVSKYPATRKLKLQAIRIGDLGIAAIPCEVFAETGLAIKGQSSLPATFTIELANGYGGYLPPPEQHAVGGYETWPARSSCLEINAEPKIRVEVLSLLKTVQPLSVHKDTRSGSTGSERKAKGSTHELAPLTSPR
ncbi:MAG: neutral/alkaline non-lysosomal ceramidase N-terminal domain-containing protein [Pirellulales bacterium]